MADAGIRAGDLVLDIGAGQGALTEPLLSAGAYVVAVELHPGRAEQLRRQFAGAPVKVVRCDASVLRLPRRPFKVVSNPPFALSSVLLTNLLAPWSRLIAGDLVLQRPVVRRWADGAPAGSARWLRTWTAESGRSLPRSAFRPPPRVDSAILVIRRR